MEQSLIQEQQLQQVQQQRLTAQQILQVKLLEMPLAQIEQAVKAELCDNPALEASTPDDDYADVSPMPPFHDTDDTDEGHTDELDRTDSQYEQQKEREDRDDALDAALDSIDSDDRLDADYRSQGDNSASEEEREEMVYGDSQSFYDSLMQQVSDEDLTSRQREIMDYLVGSLDSDGLLRKDIQTIGDELAIYNSIDCTEEEIETVLKILQSFDPAGIGARSLQECLLLQIARREPSVMRKRMAIVIAHCFELFKKKRWDKIGSHLRLTPEQTERVILELRRLNPRPGAALGETMGRNVQQVTPDFIVDTAYDGTVTFQLNNGDVPQLYVSRDFEQQLLGYQQNRDSLNRMQKEALLYTKERVERARGYIEAVQKRRQTMTVTMRAIIDIQKKFFQDGDESDIVPMTLKDVADRIGLDISTVSRVCNSKYADTRWGTFRLRHFFSEGYSVDGSSEEMSTRRIKVALAEIINHEDKKKPLSDEALAKELKRQGFPIARRTVAKYREQLGLPVARMRK